MGAAVSLSWLPGAILHFLLNHLFVIYCVCLRVCVSVFGCVCVSMSLGLSFWLGSVRPHTSPHCTHAHTRAHTQLSHPTASTKAHS